VHEGKRALQDHVFAAGQGAAFRAYQHITEIQFYIVVNSHEITPDRIEDHLTCQLVLPVKCTALLTCLAGVKTVHEQERETDIDV
jgi:hypothetical protein